LEVHAYILAGDTEPAAAWSSDPLSPITVTVGANENVQITLKGIATGSATGKFQWNIDISGLFYTSLTVSMTITQIGGVYIDTADISSNLAGPTAVKTLTSGYYYVDITLVKNGTITTKFRQVLHIFNNMTSSFTYGFVNDLFGITSGTVTMTPISYENNGTPITMTYSPPSNTPIVSGTTTITLTGSNSETITVTNESDYSSIGWTCSQTGGVLAITGSNTETLTITAGTAPFTAGTLGRLYIVSVDAVDTDGIPTSAFFYVKIMP